MVDVVGRSELVEHGYVTFSEQPVDEFLDDCLVVSGHAASMRPPAGHRYPNFLGCRDLTAVGPAGLRNYLAAMVEAAPLTERLFARSWPSPRRIPYSRSFGDRRPRQIAGSAAHDVDILERVSAPFSRRSQTTYRRFGAGEPREQLAGRLGGMPVHRRDDRGQAPLVSLSSDERGAPRAISRRSVVPDAAAPDWSAIAARSAIGGPAVCASGANPVGV
jgi:hypothetical protein